MTQIILIIIWQILSCQVFEPTNLGERRIVITRAVAYYKVMIPRLRQILSQRQKRHIVDNGNNYEPAAVLLPLYHKNGEYYLLFTKRTKKVKVHKGQISFPGGVYEKGDGRLIDTALRECTEEIGLMPDTIQILGELDDTVTETSAYIISPFVSVIPYPHQLKVNREEIEEIIEVPISALLNKDCLTVEKKREGDKVVTSYFYHWKGKIIWGATAKILNQFLDVFAQAMGDNHGEKHKAPG